VVADQIVAVLEARLFRQQVLLELQEMQEPQVLVRLEVTEELRHLVVVPEAQVQLRPEKIAHKLLVVVLHRVAVVVVAVSFGKQAGFGQKLTEELLLGGVLEDICK
jgi:HD-GYP domain-containing protein (c-di-GMP phosphodiesterase class II)